MFKTLFNSIEKQVWKVKNKQRAFVFASVLVFLLIGAAAWAVLGQFILPGLDWLLVFMGYPAMLGGFFGGMIYLYNHDFS